MVFRKLLLALVPVLIIIVGTGCTEETQQIPSVPSIALPLIDERPMWTTDGTRVLYYHSGIIEIFENGRYKVDPDSMGLWSVDTTGIGRTLLLQGFDLYGEFSPDMEWLLYESSAQIFKVPFDGSRIIPDSTVQLTQQGENFFPAWSPNGRSIAYTSRSDPTEELVIWIMASDGSQGRSISADCQFSCMMPSWSPSGSQVAHIRFLNTGNHSSEVFVIDSDGSNNRRITNNAAVDRFPRFSPAGTQIIYESMDSSDAGIWIVDADGTNPRRVRGGLNPAWSPDGRRIAFVSLSVEPGEWGTIWMMNVDGTGLKQLTQGPQ